LEQKIYLLLTFVGLLLPFSIFFPWLLNHGFDYQLLMHQLFINDVVKAITICILIITIALLVFIIIEGKHLGMQNLWLPILGTLIFGVSFGLPLFLSMREKFFHEEIR
jgi:hypothetical protein